MYGLFCFAYWEKIFESFNIKEGFSRKNMYVRTELNLKKKSAVSLQDDWGSFLSFEAIY